MGQAMETAHTGFPEQIRRGSEYPTKQLDFPGQSRGHSDLHELLTFGRIEDRIDEFLQELFPNYPTLKEDAPLPDFSGYFDQFELLEQIGQGAFSRVFKAIDKKLGNRLVVLKTGKLIEQEPSIVGRLNHKHIMPVYSSWQDELGMTTICMPYLGRYTLHDKVTDLKQRIRENEGYGGSNTESFI